MAGSEDDHPLIRPISDLIHQPTFQSATSVERKSLLKEKLTPTIEICQVLRRCIAETVVEQATLVIDKGATLDGALEFFLDKGIAEEQPYFEVLAVLIDKTNCMTYPEKVSKITDVAIKPGAVEILQKISAPTENIAQARKNLKEKPWFTIISRKSIPAGHRTVIERPANGFNKKAEAIGPLKNMFPLLHIGLPALPLLYILIASIGTKDGRLFWRELFNSKTRKDKVKILNQFRNKLIISGVTSGAATVISFIIYKYYTKNIFDGQPTTTVSE